MKSISHAEFARATFDSREFVAAIVACCESYLRHGDDDLSIMRHEMEVEDGWGTLDPAFWTDWLAALWAPRGIVLGEGGWGLQEVMIGGSRVAAEVWGGLNTRFERSAADQLGNPPTPDVTERGALEGFTWLVDALRQNTVSISRFIESLEASQGLVDVAFDRAVAATRSGLGNT